MGLSELSSSHEIGSGEEEGSLGSRGLWPSQTRILKPPKRDRLQQAARIFDISAYYLLYIASLG